MVGMSAVIVVAIYEGGWKEEHKSAAEVCFGFCLCSTKRGRRAKVLSYFTLGGFASNLSAGTNTLFINTDAWNTFCE